MGPFLRIAKNADRIVLFSPLGSSDRSAAQGALSRYLLRSRWLCEHALLRAIRSFCRRVTCPFRFYSRFTDNYKFVAKDLKAYGPLRELNMGCILTFHHSE